MRKIGHNEFAIKQAKYVEEHSEYFNITPKKVKISFEIDADILAMMKATGDTYLNRMNQCLREDVLSGRF